MHGLPPLTLVSLRLRACLPGCRVDAATQQAHNAALCALAHDATNIKAWVRLGDAFR